MGSMFGLVLVIVSVAVFWYFMPKRGRRNRLLDLPFVESLVPLAVVSGIALGVTMALSPH